MDIAALSIGLSQMKVEQQASVSVMKLALDAARGQADALGATMAQMPATPVVAQHPHCGRLLDIKA